MRSLLFGLLAILPSISMAGATYGNANPPFYVGSEQLLPHRGGYWDPTAPGSGYFVDVTRRSDASVFGFATAYTYDAEGRSTFLILQGSLQFATETQRQNEGWYAKLVSPTYQAANGQPFGGAYRPALVTPSTFGEGELKWKTRRTAELRVGGRVTQIRTLHPDDAIAEATSLLAGTWKLQLRQRTIGAPGVYFHPLNQMYFSHVVKLTPVVPAPVWTFGYGAAVLQPSAFQTVWAPPPGAITFEVSCVSECLGPNPNPPPIPAGAMPYSGARVWIDPITLRAGWVQNAVITASQTATPNFTQQGGNWSYDLYVDDDTAIGRGRVVYTNAGDPTYQEGLYPGSELIMTRVSPNGLQAPPGQEVKIY